MQFCWSSWPVLANTLYSLVWRKLGWTRTPSWSHIACLVPYMHISNAYHSTRFSLFCCMPALWKEDNMNWIGWRMVEHSFRLHVVVVFVVVKLVLDLKCQSLGTFICEATCYMYLTGMPKTTRKRWRKELNFGIKLSLFICQPVPTIIAGLVRFPLLTWGGIHLLLILCLIATAKKMPVKQRQRHTRRMV